MRTFWHPFHDTLRATIEATRLRFGCCLLIDCHSMPGSSMAPKPPADFVIGDAHGTACSPRVPRQIERLLSGMGYSVRRNDPYAGGYITRHYGRPREGMHALQLEINRGIYMDEARIERIARFDRVRRDLATLIDALAARGAEPRPRLTEPPLAGTFAPNGIRLRTPDDAGAAQPPGSALTEWERR